MASFKYCILIVAITGLAVANPAANKQWKSGLVDEMRSSCTDGNDAVECLKVKVMGFLDQLFKKDSYQISEDIEVRSNGYTDSNDISARSTADLTDRVESFLKSHDVTFKMPVAGAKVTVSPRNINDNELNLKFKFADDGSDVAEGKSKKSKLKKIILPIMVFVLLKAMTLIPLALGVLGLKAWNALQLSFFSFVVSIGLAVFQLCKKLAADNGPPHIAAHGPWERRSFDDEVPQNENGQNIAYNAYV